MNYLRAIVWTITLLIGLWFVTFAVNRVFFITTDIYRSTKGTTPIADTDIGEQCGPVKTLPTRRVEFKMNANGRIVYLCPLGWWPIQSSVMAAKLSPAFVQRLTPIERTGLKGYGTPTPPTTTPAPEAITPIPLQATPSSAPE